LLSPFDLNIQQIQKELAEILQANQNLKNKYPVLTGERLSGNPHSSGFGSLFASSYLFSEKFLI